MKMQTRKHKVFEMGLGFNKMDFCKYNKLENLTTLSTRHMKVLLKVKMLYVFCSHQIILKNA